MTDFGQQPINHGVCCGCFENDWTVAYNAFNPSEPCLHTGWARHQNWRRAGSAWEEEWDNLRGLIENDGGGLLHGLGV